MPVWIDDAICVGQAAIFFPEEETEESVAPAREICFACPNRLACLDASLYEEYGVWGGMAVWERRRFRFRLNKAFVNTMPEITPVIDNLACALNVSMKMVL